MDKNKKTRVVNMKGIKPPGDRRDTELYKRVKFGNNLAMITVLMLFIHLFVNSFNRYLLSTSLY